MRFGRWDLFMPQGFSLGFMADTVDAEIDTGGAYVPRTPPYRTGLYLHYDNHNITAELSYISYADQNKASANELPTEGFDMLDLEVGYSIESGDSDLMLFLKAKNLLDEEARDHASFVKDVAPRPGRSLVLGARYQF